MVEQAMFFGLGFLAACLITIFVANAVWRRAVRLTTRRVQAAMPVSLAEIKADRDQLRAEFALSTRKLELAVEEMKTKSHQQIVDIGRKNEQLRILLGEVKDRTEAVKTGEAREKTLRDELLASEARIGDLTRALREAETRLDRTGQDLAERERGASDAQTLADSRRVEIAALQTNLARVEEEVGDLRRQLTAAEAEKTERAAAHASAERQVFEARARIVALETSLKAAVDAARTQAEEVGRLQAKITEQAATLAVHASESQTLSTRMESLLGDRDRADQDLARRAAEAELRASALVREIEGFRADKAALEAQVAAERAERDRSADQLASLERAASENWQRERTDAALLRERMNDLAAEITAMTAVLEGEASPLQRLIASVENDQRAEATLPVAATLGPAGEVVQQSAERRTATIAERVRALQARAKIGT